MRQRNPHRLFAILLFVVVMVNGACVPTAGPQSQDACLYARITMPADPIRLEPSRDAPFVGLAFYGMRFPITGKITTCEWLKVKLPPMLQHLGAEGWIIGPPEFALIDGGGCADIPDLTPKPTPVG